MKFLYQDDVSDRIFCQHIVHTNMFSIVTKESYDIHRAGPIIVINHHRTIIRLRNQRYGLAAFEYIQHYAGSSQSFEACVLHFYHLDPRSYPLHHPQAQLVDDHAVENGGSVRKGSK